MLKDGQLPHNGTMMPTGTKRFALSSTWRREGRSCCEQGHSGLRGHEPSSNMCFCPYCWKHTPRGLREGLDPRQRALRAPRSAARFTVGLCEMQEMLIGGFCWVQDKATVPIRSTTDRPGTHSCSSGDPQGHFLPTRTFSFSLSVCILSPTSCSGSYRRGSVHGLHPRV